MICENSYYPKGNEELKPNCKYLMNDDYFKGKCPLIYYCTITQRFEQTAQMFDCKYRDKEK